MIVIFWTETVGPALSTTSALLAPNDPVAPGSASVSVAAFPAESLTVPLFKANAVVET